MATVRRTVVLTGGRAGQTCKLLGFQFVDGKLVLRGDGDRVAKFVSQFERQYQAYELGSDELEAALGTSQIQSSSESAGTPSVPGGVQPDEREPADVPARERIGDGGSPDDIPEESVGDVGPELPAAAGHQHPRVDSILEGLSKLDPENKAHWTADGLPKVSVVAEFTNLPDLMRRDIDTVAPDFKRKGSPNG